MSYEDGSVCPWLAFFKKSLYSTEEVGTVPSTVDADNAERSNCINTLLFPLPEKELVNTYSSSISDFPEFEPVFDVVSISTSVIVVSFIGK